MHRLPDDNEDNAPFQIDPLGVHGKQLYRRKPPVDENLFSGTPPRRSQASPRTPLVLHWPARSPPLDFFDVPLAGEETASELLDVTLAQEDARLGARRTRQKP